MTDPHLFAPDGRPRARALGITFGGTPGPLNALTDVAGVEVGYVTLIHGDGPLVVNAGPVRTGVTAILPRGRAEMGVSCAAGWHSLNGNGEMTGTHWLTETGALSSAVVLTNTYGVGACHRGVVDWVVARQPEKKAWDFPVVAETYDGYLSDTDGSHVRAEQAVQAMDDARGGAIQEGSVGGGTGMNCYGFKGGNGTASRVVAYGGGSNGGGSYGGGSNGGGSYVVGAFVQANFGRRRELVVAGRPVGAQLLDDNPLESTSWFLPPGAGSVIAVVATDAPLLPQQCQALARRVTLGLARTGTTGSHSSGDIFLAFSTGNPGAFAARADAGLVRLDFVPWDHLDPFFEATVQAVEEAVINALIVNRTMIGRDGNHSPALPHDVLLDLLHSASAWAPMGPVVDGGPGGDSIR